MNAEQTQIELAKKALQQVINYREGNGRFNLSHIGDLAKRHNESLDLWYEVEADVRDALKALDNL